MTHQWHDTYQHWRTPAHHLDPRAKIGVGILFVVTVLCSPALQWSQAAGYAAILMGVVLLGGLSIVQVAARMVRLLPFLLLMLISSAFSHVTFIQWSHLLMRSVLSISAMTLVALTTPFPDVLRALQEMRVPRLLLLFLAFLYRYTAVLGKEAQRLERGWSARYFGQRWSLQVSRLGHVLAALLIRSYERAERIYAAMLARGFSDQSRNVHVLHFTRWDLLLLLSTGITLGVVRWGMR